MPALHPRRRDLVPISADVADPVDAVLPGASLPAAPMYRYSGSVHQLGSRRRRQRRTVSGGLQEMDAWIWQAITAGWVDLPRCRVHTAVRFQLLRTLLDELGATIAECSMARSAVRQVWEMTDHPARAGQYRWRPYEQPPAAAQGQTLEVAAAAAIDAIRLHMTTGLVLQSRLGPVPRAWSPGWWLEVID